MHKPPPPHSLDAERAVLGSVLIKPSLVGQVGLEADDFFLPAHREVWAAMQAVRKRGMPPEIVPIVTELTGRGSIAHLQGGGNYLVELAESVTTAENIEHYERIVVEKATLRRAILMCADFGARAMGDPDLEGYLSELRAEIMRLSTIGPQQRWVMLRDAVPPVLDAIEARKDKRDQSAIVFGFSDLDVVTGGVWPEDLIIVAGRPGSGKTSLAVGVAVNAAKGRNIPALVCSLEMSTARLIERMLSHDSKVETQLLRTGRLEAHHWDRIDGAGHRLRGWPISIDDTSQTLEQIETTARRWRAEQPIGAPAVLVVDYLQLVRHRIGQGRNREQEVAELSRRFKALAKELKLPAMVLSQLNRDVEREGRRPRLSDLRESGAIEQDADMAIFVHRDMTKDPHSIDTEEREAARRAEFIVAKNRNGETGVAHVVWMPELMMFGDKMPDYPEERQYVD